MLKAATVKIILVAAVVSASIQVAALMLERRQLQEEIRRLKNEQAAFQIQVAEYMSEKEAEVSYLQSEIRRIQGKKHPF